MGMGCATLHPSNTMEAAMIDPILISVIGLTLVAITQILYFTVAQ